MTGNRAPRRLGFGWPLAILLGVAVVAGGFAGYNQAHLESGDATLAPWIGPLVAIGAGAAGLMLYMRRHRDEWRQFSPRKKLYWLSLSLACALGIVIAVLLQAGQIDGGSNIFGVGALNASVAIVLALLWVIGMAIALFFYHGSIDDHEREAYHLSAVAGFYAFVIPCPVWWVLARANLVPPVEAMPLFVVSLIANGLVYLWFKFR